MKTYRDYLKFENTLDLNAVSDSFQRVFDTELSFDQISQMKGMNRENRLKIWKAIEKDIDNKVNPFSALDVATVYQYLEIESLTEPYPTSNRAQALLGDEYGLIFHGSLSKPHLYATPTETFWQAWNEDKDALKAQGYWVEKGKKRGEWTVCKRKQPRRS